MPLLPVSDRERCLVAGFECIGVDVESSSLYKANHGGEWRDAAREGWEQKLPDCPDENKIPISSCNLPGVPSTADDLAQLFDAIPSKVWISASASYGYTDRIPFSSLQSTLNISNFFLWQMATVVNFNIDTGSHNYVRVLDLGTVTVRVVPQDMSERGLLLAVRARPHAGLRARGI